MSVASQEGRPEPGMTFTYPSYAKLSPLLFDRVEDRMVDCCCTRMGSRSMELARPSRLKTMCCGVPPS